MLMHDHEKKPAAGHYCPLMRGICVDGWTKEMGEDKDGRRPLCIAWRPVTLMVGGPHGTPKEAWDCTIGWLPDLIVQNSQESYRAGAASEGVRNHVAGQAHFFKQMAVATMAVARKSGVTREDAAQISQEIKEDFEADQKRLSGPCAPPSEKPGG